MAFADGAQVAQGGFRSTEMVHAKGSQAEYHEHKAKRRTQGDDKLIALGRKTVALRTVESEAIARSVHCDKEVAADQGVDGAWEPMLESPPMTPNGLSATALAILHCCRATALLPGDGTAAGRRRKIREPASVDAEPFLQELAGIDG